MRPSGETATAPCGRLESPGEVAIAWVLRQPAVTAAIVGARKPDQLRQLISAAEWRLSAAEVDEIERFWRRTQSEP